MGRAARSGRDRLAAAHDPPRLITMTRIPRFRALLAAAALLVCTWQLSAAPGFWQAATQADFLKGDIDQLSVDRHGRLTLGPEVKKVFDGAVTVVWAMTSTPDGTTYLGTGN